MKHRDDMDDIYREHGKTVYRFFLRMCGDAELAQDLTQDTFLRAMESADRFDGSCKMTT